ALPLRHVEAHPRHRLHPPDRLAHLPNLHQRAQGHTSDGMTVADAPARREANLAVAAMRGPTRPCAGGAIGGTGHAGDAGRGEAGPRPAPPRPPPPRRAAPPCAAPPRALAPRHGSAPRRDWPLAPPPPSRPRAAP